MVFYPCGAIFSTNSSDNIGLNNVKAKERIYVCTWYEYVKAKERKHMTQVP